jgi:phosphate transport system substrate-binding protein
VGESMSRPKSGPLESKDKSGPPLYVYFLLALLLSSGAYYFFTSQNGLFVPEKNAQSPSTATPAALNLPDILPAGSSIRLESASSLVKFNDRIGQVFTKRYPGVSYTWKTSSSLRAIQSLLAGETDVAAIARPLTEEEKSKGLVAVPVKTDAIAILVGKENPFQGKLTSEQLRKIFSGKVTNWSQVGGVPLPMRIINRPPDTGTYKTFQKAALGGGDFGNGPQWVLMKQSGSTEVLQKLRTNGISYVNYSEVKTQKSIRALPLDDSFPGAPDYPLISVFYYVYGPNATEAAKALVGFAASPAGQTIAALD